MTRANKLSVAALAFSLLIVPKVSTYPVNSTECNNMLKKDEQKVDIESVCQCALLPIEVTASPASDTAEKNDFAFKKVSMVDRTLDISACMKYAQVRKWFLDKQSSSDKDENQLFEICDHMCTSSWLTLWASITLGLVVLLCLIVGSVVACICR